MSNSLLQSVVADKAVEFKQNFNPQAIIAGLVSGLEEKARNVISSRTGLSGDKKVTLSYIGDHYHLSRERIRQIERDVMAKLSDKLHEKHYHEIQFVVATIDREGGVVNEETLVKLLLIDSRRTSADINSLRLFLRLTKDVVEVKDSKTMRPGWVLRMVTVAKIDSIVQDLILLIQQSGSVMTFESVWEQMPALHDRPQSFLKQIISLSRDIVKTTEGTFGLSSWPTVNPRNVRDKIYFVLNQSGTPLHFTEIAKRIRENSFDAKNIVQPTVHNELIADERFVLVGRGIYALSHWGYQPGTVEQVIEDVLKKAGKPLSTDEIVELVLKSRQVRKNTIIINLQIKPQFVKVGRKLYTLSEVKSKNVSDDVKQTIKLAEKK
ncbi:MAG: sigma factor-like helix-turn-helix DNA-binding protein [Patescibacteria group bacterium]|jgi:hypothetical protein